MKKPCILSVGFLPCSARLARKWVLTITCVTCTVTAEGIPTTGPRACYTLEIMQDLATSVSRLIFNVVFKLPDFVAESDIS